VPHNPRGRHSFIDFPDGERYYVRAHVGAGAYGSICTISTDAPGAPLRILKLQVVQWESEPNQVIEKIKEAIINYILHSTYPDFTNQIFKIGIGPRIRGRTVKIFYVLEKLTSTMKKEIEDIGNPPGPLLLDPHGFDLRQATIGIYLKGALCTISRGLKRIYEDLQGNHGDCKTDNIMDNKLIDFGMSRLQYEGTWLSAGSKYNTRSSESRDLTNLIYYAWHYNDGHTCSIKDTLRPLLGWPNPDASVFRVFESWAGRNAAPIPDPPYADIPVNSVADFRMITRSAGVAARKAARLAAPQEPGEGAYDRFVVESSVDLEDASRPIGLGPLYLYFNVFDNPSCTFDTVRAAMCPAPPPPPPRLLAASLLTGGRHKVAGKPLNRTRRYTRKDAKTHRKDNRKDNRKNHRRTHRKTHASRRT
jgi:hypothetical protein